MVYKVAQQSATLRPSSTLGVITSGPRVSVTRLGSEHFVATPVGCSFHIYDCDDLQLQYLSRPLTEDASGVLCVGEATAVSLAKNILIFHKMKLLARLEGHASKVETMTNLGDSFLVSSSATEVLVWQLPTFTKQSHELTKPLSAVRRLEVSFRVSSILHVPTYMNKMLVSGVNGELELWNINTGSKIYSFSCVSGLKSGISCLASSPALDVVGLGFDNGSIAVVHLKQDELIMTLKQTEHGGVTALSFRHDSVGGQLVSGTAKGDLVVWDLNKKTIHSFHQGLHPGGVGSLDFLESLPLLLSAGSSDNALSIHIFDKPDGGCRMLKERRGFTADIAKLMPYGEHDLLVSGSNDSGLAEVGKLNLIQSQQNKVWSQGSLHSQTPGKGSLMPWKFRNMHQLPTLTSMSYCAGGKLRHFDWPSVVTTHVGVPDAYVWSPHQQALVTRMLIVPRKATTGAKAPDAVVAAVSTCGNYAVLGLENGEIHRFNLQSCYYRGIVGSLTGTPGHIEFLSAREILTADTESIRLWKVVPRATEIATLRCVTDIDSVAVNGFLCAVAHKRSRAVSIIDVHADRKARTVPVTAPVTAMAWAQGGRWIAIATADAKLIIYDLPTAAVVDRIEFDMPVASLLWTQNNASLVSSHIGGKGAVRVWQNVALLEGPGVVTDHFVKIDKWEASRVAPTVGSAQVTVMTPPPEETDGELTLSAGSRTKWQQILKLDDIKERNKPVKAAEKPKEAPFFLPVKYQGMEPVFVAQDTPVNAQDNTEVKRQKNEHDSGYLRMVAGGNFAALRQHLLLQTPSGVHICIAELEDDEDCIDKFIAFLAAETEAGRNLDLVATWTSLFLKVYSSLVRLPKFAKNLARLEVASRQVYEKFEIEANQLQCLVKVTAALQLHR